MSLKVLVTALRCQEPHIEGGEPEPDDVEDIECDNEQNEDEPEIDQEEDVDMDIGQLALDIKGPNIVPTYILWRCVALDT